MNLADFHLTELAEYFQNLNTEHPVIARSVVFFSAIIIGMIVNWVMGGIFRKLITIFLQRRGKLDKEESVRIAKISKRLANLCFIGSVYFILAYMNVNVYLIVFFRKICQILTVVVITTLMMHGVMYIEIWYNRQPGAANRSIKGGIQLLRIFLVICAIILCVSILVNRSPVFLLSGLGCAAAVLMLVFQDTLLALVSGIQLSADKLVRIGDWIVIPSEDVDGEVTDITLHTIKVRLWDQTVVAVPVRKLTQGSFINYRSMFEIGGRRIKRSINIDIHSIRFMSDEEIQKLKQYAPLKEYLQQKPEKLDGIPDKKDELLTGNSITNLGVFRRYVEFYLRSLPTINQHLTLLVRQMQSQSTGLPLEIYCFSALTAWGDYEAIQAEIFEHLFAILPLFGLQVYQRSSDAVSQD